MHQPNNLKGDYWATPFTITIGVIIVGDWMWRILCRILPVPHNIVMDVNNVTFLSPPTLIYHTGTKVCSSRCWWKYLLPFPSKCFFGWPPSLRTSFCKPADNLIDCLSNTPAKIWQSSGDFGLSSNLVIVIWKPLDRDELQYILWMMWYKSVLGQLVDIIGWTNLVVWTYPCVTVSPQSSEVYFTHYTKYCI